MIHVNSPQFDIGLVNQLVRDQGQEVFWHSSIKCPNHRIDTGDPLQICNLCSGYGVRWQEPYTVQGLITSVDHRVMFDAPGWWAKGECIFSPPTWIQPSRYDKVQFKQVIEQSEVRTRGTDDHISFIPIRIIQIIDVNGVEYDSDDVTVVEGSKIKGQRTIVWAVDAGPVTGTRYSIRYIFFPEWLVWDVPHIRFANNVDLGRRVLLRRFDLAWVGA